MRESPLRPAVVLVTDRTLAADYRVLLEGMVGTMQTTSAPSWLVRRLLAPPGRRDRFGRARVAGLGLRRIESSLLSDGGLAERDVVCTTPEALGEVLGPWVKLVGFSSGDPLGRGMSNTTTVELTGGELYTRRWTAGLLGRLRQAKDRYGFAVWAGGPGAWQWLQDPAQAERLGVDRVFEGYFEAQGPGLVADLLAGRTIPKVVRETDNVVDRIRPIRGPSTMGVIEISRGCGRGCAFCASAERRMDDLPGETILADAQTNAAAGAGSLVCGGEDFFRYGSAGAKVNFERLRSLLAAMRRIDHLGFVQADHANVSSVLQLDAGQLSELARLLRGGGRLDYLWVNIGIESANGHLVHANGPGKIAPFRPEDWEAMVLEAAGRLREAGIFPVFSVVLGLPGETPQDIRRTRRLVEVLAERPVIVFPIFYEPLPGRGEAPPFRLDRMDGDHAELFATCYRINFRWVPRVFWDNQRAGGVRWPRRAAQQVMGRAEVLLWRRRLRRMVRGAAARPAPNLPQAPQSQPAVKVSA